MAEPWGFTLDQVSQLTGLSLHQLRYWREKDFFVPEYVDEDRRTFGRIYSFRDVVGLRTVALLRNEHQVPLQELRRVDAWLKEHQETPWASLTFYVGGRHVYLDDRETQTRVEGRKPRQAVMPIEMEKIASDITRRARCLQERRPEQIGEITHNRYVMHNQPVVAGTRIPTSAIWSFHRAGYDEKAILAQYPRLTPEDVHRAIEYERERRAKKAG